MESLVSWIAAFESSSTNIYRHRHPHKNSDEGYSCLTIFNRLSGELSTILLTRKLPFSISTGGTNVSLVRRSSQHFQANVVAQRGLRRPNRPQTAITMERDTRMVWIGCYSTALLLFFLSMFMILSILFWNSVNVSAHLTNICNLPTFQDR